MRETQKGRAGEIRKRHRLYSEKNKTSLSTPETLRSRPNQKILYSVPVLDKIRPCQARYHKTSLSTPETLRSRPNQKILYSVPVLDKIRPCQARYHKTSLSTSETLRSGPNQKILYSEPVLDKICPCQARYDEKRLYWRQEPLDQAQIERYYYMVCLFWTKYVHVRHDIIKRLYRRQKRLDQAQIKRSYIDLILLPPFRIKKYR